MKDTLLELNPDAFSRFQIVCNEIKKHFGTKTVELLDIGGASPYMDKFLRANNISFHLTIVDIIDFDNKPKNAKVVVESAEKLTFKDKTFDVVTGIDMLEHIPGLQTKINIVNEAFRVSKDLIVFAGPFESSQVTKYEKKLNFYNKEFFGMDQVWLSEHFKYGKPRLSVLESLADKADIKYFAYSALPLSDWYISSMTNLIPAVSPSISNVGVKQVNRLFNKAFFNHDIRSEFEGYRTFFIASHLRNIPATQGSYNETDNIEKYFECLTKGLFLTRNHESIKMDLNWHKKEHSRLTKGSVDMLSENKRLIEEKKENQRIIAKLKGGKIVNRARSLENRLRGDR